MEPYSAQIGVNIKREYMTALAVFYTFKLVTNLNLLFDIDCWLERAAAWSPFPGSCAFGIMHLNVVGLH